MLDNILKLYSIVKEGFASCQALVVGDVMLDKYLWCNVSRISPEGPVPIAHVQRQSDAAGGAGNVAVNLATLGANVSIVGLIGADEEGRALSQVLMSESINVSEMIEVPAARTITKVRVIGGHQQMLRVDFENAAVSISSKEIFARVQKLLKRGINIVVLSDYCKGTLSPELCQSIIALCRESSVPVLIDPKGTDYSKYTNATCITPNVSELKLAVGLHESSESSLMEAAKNLREKLNLDYLVLTRSEFGISLISNHVQHIPAVAREVYDVSGAGDTVVATLAACIAVGCVPSDALRVANIAAGVVVGKVGTAPIKFSELCGEMSGNYNAAKYYGLDQLKAKIQVWRSMGKKIVFTNGCFDILHMGHITYLQKARQEGDVLVVGLNSDKSVRSIKGPERPVNNEDNRASLLASLAVVDAVAVFDEDTPLNMIMDLRPDVLVKGADYQESEIVGGVEVKSWGGRIVRVPLVANSSTTSIIDKIKKQNA